MNCKTAEAYYNAVVCHVSNIFIFKKLSGGAMMIGYIEVTRGGVILCDSQRTALSRRVIDLDTVSYCGITR